jgi:hypothetical protein
MNLRWLWFDQIPPELALTREQKQSARKRASLHRKREPNYRGSQRRYTLIFLPIFVVGFVAYWMWLDHQIQTRRLNPITSGVLLMLLTYGAIAFSMHRTRTPFIRRALRDMGYDICEGCGYWLRGLGDDVQHCPECGAAREPSPKRSPDIKREPGES